MDQDYSVIYPKNMEVITSSVGCQVTMVGDIFVPPYEELNNTHVKLSLLENNDSTKYYTQTPTDMEWIIKFNEEHYITTIKFRFWDEDNRRYYAKFWLQVNGEWVELIEGSFRSACELKLESPRKVHGIKVMGENTINNQLHFVNFDVRAVK